MSQRIESHQGEKHFFSTNRLYALGTLVIVLLAGLIYITIQQGSVDSPGSPSEVPLISASGSEVPAILPDFTLISMKPHDVDIHLHTNADYTVVVDVRPTEVREEQGYIEGSVSLPLDEFDERALSELDKDKNIILVCQDGEKFSVPAANWLYEHGYTNIRRLDGGVNAWLAAGYTLCEDCGQP